MNNKKGFTLIELLVVVAIIGVLATIVLASLGAARTRAKDAAVVSAMSSYRTEIEIDFSDGNYTNLCSSQTYSNLVSDVQDNGGSVFDCIADNSSYVIISTLPSAAAELAFGTNVAYAAGEPYVCIDGNGLLKKLNRSDFGGADENFSCNDAPYRGFAGEPNYDYYDYSYGAESCNPNDTFCDGNDYGYDYYAS